MRSEFKSHKRSDTVKWIAVFMAIIMLAATVSAVITEGFSNWNPYGWFDKVVEDDDTDGNNIDDDVDVDVDFNARILLSNTTINGLSAVITASVYPENATDKSISWSAAWAPDASRASEDVLDYVVLTPDENNSRILDLTCIQAFSGDSIIVTATALGGNGVFAACTVNYIGIPTEVGLGSLSILQTMEVAPNVMAYRLEEDTEYLIPLTATNALGVVSQEWKKNKIIGTGYVTFVKYKVDNPSDTETITNSLDYAGWFRDGDGVVNEYPLLSEQFVEIDGVYYYKLRTGKYYTDHTVVTREWEVDPITFEETNLVDVTYRIEFVSEHLNNAGDGKRGYFTYKFTELISGFDVYFHFVFDIPVQNASVNPSGLSF